MSGGGGPQESAEWAALRISDSDRDRIAGVLSEHAVEGRLTIDELDERLGTLNEALTRGEARAVMAGLPALEPVEVHHQPHHGGGHDSGAPTLPEWLRTFEPAGRPSSSTGATQAIGRADADVTRPAPSDEAMQAAYDAWRAAHAKAKAGRKASRHAAAAGDKAAAFRQLSESVRLTAAEKSRRAKLNDLRKLRPDWTTRPPE